MLRVRRTILAGLHPAKALPPNSSVFGPEDDCPDRTVEKELRSRNRELFALLEISQAAAKSLEAEKKELGSGKDP